MRKHLFYLLLLIPLLGICQTWNEEVKLILSERNAGDQFGSTVDISGDYAVVGALISSEGSKGEVYVYKRNGENWSEYQTLVPDDGQEGDSFGYNGVAIGGEYIIITAMYEDEDENGENTMNNSGAVYVFKLEENHWVQKQKLVASDRSNNRNFGASIAIDGDYILIGARNGSPGAVYVFKNEQDNWIETQKITASDNLNLNNFGRALNSIAIEGNIAVIGASNNNNNGDNSSRGAVYVFELENDIWEEKQILTADEIQPHQFGESVDIGGNYIVIGAPRDSYISGDYIDSAGAAYIFKKNEDNWVQSQKIVVEEAAYYDLFGKSVAINGSYVVIGANQDNGQTHVGFAIIYKLEQNWIKQQKIIASDAPRPLLFGHGIGIDDSKNIIVGALRDNEGDWQEAAGAAYIFRLDCSYLVPEVNEVAAICSGESTDITVSSDTETVNWYESEDAETPLFTGSIFTTPELDETTSFWVEINDGTCTSGRVEITVNVNPLPEMEAETSYEICSGDEAHLYAFSEGNVIFWYTNEDDTEYLYHGNNFITDELTETITYWVEAFNLQTGCFSERIEVTITVNPVPSAPIAVNVQIAEEGQTLADLEDEIEAEGELIWYADAALTIVLPNTTPVQDATDYWVTQTINGCESEATTIEVQFLGIGEVNESVFAYYPNPVKDNLHFTGKETVKSVQVYDMSGKLILDQSSNSISRINLSTLPKGTYMVRATTDKGMNTFKIVKN